MDDQDEHFFLFPSGMEKKILQNVVPNEIAIIGETFLFQVNSSLSCSCFTVKSFSFLSSLVLGYSSCCAFLKYTVS